MSEHGTEASTNPVPSHSATTPYPPASQATGWVGWVMFASTMMVLLGFFHVIQGLVAVFRDAYFVVTDDGLTVSMDYTVWGWTHMLAGAVIAIAGLSLFSGHWWARVVGVGLAMTSALLNFGFIRAYPWWSVIAIVLDVFVILALTAHGGEMASARGKETRVPRQQPHHT